jgi:hypothetical protein
MTTDNETSGTSPQEAAAKESDVRTQPNTDDRMNMFGLTIDIDPTRLRLIVADLKLMESKEAGILAAINELERIAGTFEKAAILRSKIARGEMTAAQAAGCPPQEILGRMLSALSGRAVQIVGIGPDGPPPGIADDCDCSSCVARRAAEEEAKKTTLQ